MAKDSNRVSTGGSSEQSDSGSATSVLRDGVSRVKDEAVDTLKQGAQALSEQARERVEGYTEGGKEVVRQHLDDFASAVRRASDELSEHDQTLASQFVRQAAGGLESLSRSVDNTSFGDLVDSVRRFGRRNPAAFIGGAVLAGLALGRFARASSRQTDWEDDGEDWRSGREPYPARDANGRFIPRAEWDSRGGNEGISPRPYSGAGQRGGASDEYASGGSDRVSSFGEFSQDTGTASGSAGSGEGA